ncbi:hypothetical protein R3P38DRAFT_2771756 [Favolaschia claudopus]|uniref:Amine oxidase domain-containing protein n=1 Tax=Favolaschia claudopus TaxID=2862362 RepID=A0AAW0CBG3_9AGAR
MSLDSDHGGEISPSREETPASPLMQLSERRPPKLKVGIVGGGIAGLYAALLLQNQGHLVRIFEGTDRVGGRIHTHYFSQEDNQYFEAGAMRIPDSEFHGITFDLIRYIQLLKLPKPLPPDLSLKLIDYILAAPGNFIFINGQKPPEIAVSDITPSTLNWPDIPAEYNKAASVLMMDAIGRLIDGLKQNFEQGFKDLLQYDQFSFRYYLLTTMRYPSSVIDFLETVLSQTNQFSLSVPELVLQNMDFNTKHWYTIDKGMSRLPNAMAYLLGRECITYGARVTGIYVSETTKKVGVEAFGSVTRLRLLKISS